MKKSCEKKCQEYRELIVKYSILNNEEGERFDKLLEHAEKCQDQDCWDNFQKVYTIQLDEMTCLDFQISYLIYLNWTEEEKLAHSDSLEERTYINLHVHGCKECSMKTKELALLIQHGHATRDDWWLEGLLTKEEWQNGFARLEKEDFDKLVKRLSRGKCPSRNNVIEYFCHKKRSDKKQSNKNSPLQDLIAKHLKFCDVCRKIYEEMELEKKYTKTWV